MHVHVSLGMLVYVKPGASSQGLPMRVGRVVTAGEHGALVCPLWPAASYPFGWGWPELEPVTGWRALWLWLTSTLWTKLRQQGGRA
jgi:hypothetical protein